jgi:hypothetical protein
MNEPKKSDLAIVAMKPANKAGAITPGRNRNHNEKTGNFSVQVPKLYADTPKDTPSKRWLLSDVVG